MTVLAVRKVRSALNKKGFVEEGDRDHLFFIFVRDGRKLAKTKISHGASEIDDNLISLMSRQMHISKDKFCDFVECTLSEDGYLDLLQQQRLV